MLPKPYINTSIVFGTSSFCFVHPPVQSWAPCGERNHGKVMVHNGLTCRSVSGFDNQSLRFPVAAHSTIRVHVLAMCQHVTAGTLWPSFIPCIAFSPSLHIMSFLLAPPIYSHSVFSPVYVPFPILCSTPVLPSCSRDSRSMPAYLSKPSPYVLCLSISCMASRGIPRTVPSRLPRSPNSGSGSQEQRGPIVVWQGHLHHRRVHSNAHQYLPKRLQHS